MMYQTRSLRSKRRTKRDGSEATDTPNVTGAKRPTHQTCSERRELYTKRGGSTATDAPNGRQATKRGGSTATDTPNASTRSARDAQTKAYGKKNSRKRFIS